MKPRELSRIAFSFSSIVCLASACGDAEGTESEEACAALARAECEYAAACDQRWLEQYYGSVAQCLESFGETCQGLAALPGSRRTAEWMSGCATALSSGGCNGYPQACTPPEGTLRVGASCALNEQCASGSCGWSGVDEACGACLEPFVYEEGEASPCDTSEECGDYEYCADGRCSPKLGVGDDCSASIEDPCDGRIARCIDGRCEMHPLASSGEACIPWYTPASPGNCRESYCLVESAATEGRCVPYAREGETCDKFYGCESGTTCSSGKCRKLSRNLCR